MASETKSAVVKIKSSNLDGSSKGKFDSSLNRKKIESSAKPMVDSKPKIVSTVVKSEVKSKTTMGSGSLKVTTKKTTSRTTVKQKKVYTLPGQRYDPPEEREPLRIFYESLSKQIPTSEMAEFWMMEHGMLSPERAKKAYEKKQRRQKQIRSGTPIKSSKPPSRPESSNRPQQQASRNGDVKPKKRIASNSDDDDEFILSPKRRRV